MIGRTRHVVALLIALVAGALPAAGDLLVVGAITYRDIQIGNVDGTTVSFRMGSKILSKSVLEVTFVNIDGLTALNEAEDLLAKGKAREAVAEYAKAENAQMPLGRTGLKLLVTYRKLAAAKKAGMIVEATRTWLALMDATNGDSGVIRLRPQPPKAKSPDNDRAVTLLKAKENTSNKAYAAAVRELRVQLLNVQGRADEARTLATRMAAGDPGSSRYVVESKLTAAASHVQTGDADKAVAILRPLLKDCDAARLPRAMLLLGRAQLLLASKAQGQEKHKLLCEAALNFVRVTAFFGSSQEEASQALYYAGRVNESLDKPNLEAARKAYTEVIKRYKDAPAAAQAREALSALREKGK